MKTYFVIPANLDLPTLLEANGFHSFTKAIMLDKLYYLIDLLMRKTSLFHKSTDYFPLKADYLRAIIGPRYARLAIGALLTLGIVETDHSYKVGAWSIGYRLAKQFQVADVRRVVIKDSKLALRIEKQNKERLAETVEGKANLKLIARTLGMVTIDFANADLHMREHLFPTVRAKETRLNQLEAFRERDFYLTVDHQGRVHHNFVALSNDLKSFATINENPIFAVDVGNMQPALLSLFYQSECEEKSRYVALVSGNEFYNFFNERMGKPVDLRNEAQKKKFKRLLFKNYLFCKNRVRHEIKDIFQKEFPVLAEVIQTMKTGCHQRLARKLQEIEASIVIDKVAMELTVIHPDMPLLSVHDCIATTAPFVGIVEQLMKREFYTVLGFEVPVSSKRVSSLLEGTQIC